MVARGQFGKLQPATTTVLTPRPVRYSCKRVR